MILLRIEESSPKSSSAFAKRMKQSPGYFRYCERSEAICPIKNHLICFIVRPTYDAIFEMTPFNPDFWIELIKDKPANEKGRFVFWAVAVHPARIQPIYFVELQQQLIQPMQAIPPRIE